MNLVLALAWVLVGVLSWGWFLYSLDYWLKITPSRSWMNAVCLIVGAFSGLIALCATIFVSYANGFKLRAGLRFL